ncbi:MAG: glycosyl transferase family 2, partial [Lachnospiraceae bacterium]|nr:glycosyl transferase family 2 [Lachnospiraceae bacterium]
MRQIEFVKYNRTRAEKFQLKTAIVRENGTLSVEKTALSEEGAAHIRSFEEKFEKIKDLNPSVKFLKPEFSNGGKTVKFEYLKGETIGDVLGEQIQMGEVPYEALTEAMALVFPEDFAVSGGKACAETFVPGAEFKAVFGDVPEMSDRIVKVSNVDGLFENLMVSDGTVYGIDYEWVFDFPIPAKFLHFRNLLYFYRRYENVLKCSQEEIFEHFGIGAELQEIFMEMEMAFQSYVHGEGNFQYMKQYEQEAKTIEYLLDRENELKIVKEWCENLKAEIAEKDVTIVKQQEVQRLTNNHVANLDVIIADLRRENAEIAKTLHYLAKHESIIWKVLRKCHKIVNKILPKGTRKRKVLTYVKNTLLRPAKYGKLYFTAEGRNLIRGDFKIGEGYMEHGKLKFPYFENPTVSIVIPVYNQIHYTYACLVSILQNTPDVTYEVIIADDVSSD